MRFLVLFSFSKHNKPHFANSEFTKWGINGVLVIAQELVDEVHLTFACYLGGDNVVNY